MTALWLPSRPKPRKGSLDLFCIPHAGAGASIYRGWAALLPPSILVSPVQLPGREERFAETPRTAISQLADELTEVLAASVNGPYALFGYSMGALIAFETARRLRKAGGPMPLGIILAAHQAPQLPLVRKPIWNLPQIDFLRELRAMGGMPDEVFDYPELIEFVLPALRADFTACDNYVWTNTAPLDIPFAIFGGWKDPFLPRQSIEAWREHSSQPSSMRMFPGGHFFLNENRDLLLHALVHTLTQWLIAAPDRQLSSSPTTQ